MTKKFESLFAALEEKQRWILAIEGGSAAGKTTLAKHLQEALVKTLNPTSNRQAKRADGIYLMENIHCTGVLIECGFLSNVGEEKLLMDETYRQTAVESIVSGLAEYLQLRENLANGA